jgi:aminoglycoside phosphotransferase (APT) family kinase protein
MKERSDEFLTLRDPSLSSTLHLSSQDIDTCAKLAEGGFNRVFFYHHPWGLRDGSPHPVPRHGPQRFHTIARELATMCFLRSSGLPVPDVYDYSASPDNAGKTEYIFMEFMRGTKLSGVWQELEEPDIVSVLRQLT